MEEARTHTYGPVPSRRLGRSLGIDLVPFKTCTYDCVYCQLGRTTDKTLERKHYVPIDEILAELRDRLACIQRPDYITLAGSGEPTLHEGIGELVRGIKETTDVPVAVLTNGSLLWMSAVRRALMSADLVVPSLDAGDESSFQGVNRPHRAISFEAMVEGLVEFTRDFPGEVWLEVLLLAGITSSPADVSKIAAHVERIRPARTQLNTAWRPPAEADIRAMSHEALQAAQDAFPGEVDIAAERSERRPANECRVDVEGDDIVALLDRRPCTAVDIATGLGIHVAEVLKSLDRLTATGSVSTVSRRGRTYYVPGPRG